MPDRGPHQVALLDPAASPSYFPDQPRMQCTDLIGTIISRAVWRSSAGWHMMMGHRQKQSWEDKNGCIPEMLHTLCMPDNPSRLACCSCSASPWLGVSACLDSGCCPCSAAGAGGLTGLSEFPEGFLITGVPSEAESLLSAYLPFSFLGFFCGFLPLYPLCSSVLGAF